jgi:hypothetical protein
MMRVIAAALAAALTAPVAEAASFAPIDLRAIPITAFKPGADTRRFGALEFRGGLELVSGAGNFGAWSGLDFGADGALYAISDTGLWLRGNLVETDGLLSGFSGAAIAPLLADNGKPFPSKVAGDAEGLRIVREGGASRALISFEQTTTVRSYAGADFTTAKPKRVSLPKFVGGIRRNQGLEAIAVAPAGGTLGGATVVFAERSLDAKGNHRGFVLSGPKAGEFSIRRSDEFDVTDAAFLPDGDLLVLERRFSFSGGFGMRIRRIDDQAIKPGATLEGTLLVEAGTGFQIDNLEGMAVRTAPTGETLITLISDNNGSMLQRTILLQFALAAEPAPPPQN